MKHLALAVTLLFISVGLLATPALADRGKGDNVVRVAPPTGDPATDVANIDAAIAAAGPGGTVKFRRGTYQVFEDTQFLVTTPGVTLKGAGKRKTTIRGVRMDEFVPDYFLGLIQLVGGEQTVEDLAFRDFGTAVGMGSPGTALGGYVIEDCVFRDGQFAVEVVGFSDDITTVEDNRFVNVLSAITVTGKTVHFRDNRVTAPRPETIPVLGQPFLVAQVFPEFLSGINICENNVLEGNTIVGQADGFELVADFPGEVCRNNVIRDNEFIDMKVFSGSSDGSMVFLFGSDVGRLEDNLVKHNELEGSEGLGIVVQAASNNRIVDNEIEDLPGEKVPFSAGFRSVLPGTGIFLDELSSGNVVDENELEDVRNPILDLGDNRIGDNEIENDDEDGDERDAPALPRSSSGKASTGSLGSATKSASSLPVTDAMSKPMLRRLRAL